MAEISYRRHRFPPVIIQHAVWVYLRFTLSYRDVEELLAERGLDISYETVRCWVLKFTDLELVPHGSLLTPRWREIVWTPSAGQGRFWLGTVMSVAGLCPACSRGNAAGLDGLSASRGSHLDFALDAHSLAAGLPR